MFAEEGAVSSEDELTAAIAKGGTVKLANDITISSSLNISGTVTLDLNDHVLKMTGSGSVIQVNGTLTLTDSAENKTAKYFSKDANGLWTLTDGITENTVSGGVITGGSTGIGGGVMIRTGGTLAMTGGNIAGCRVNGQGGGVYVSGGGTFTMNGGTIAGCVADMMGAQGGGIFNGGIFNGKVQNYDRISGGVFKSDVINGAGEITGGTFYGTVTNHNGRITGGTFHAGVFGTGHITGSGTAEDPYQIVTAQGLKAFRDIVNGANGAAQNPAACAVLTEDIDLNNEKWTPIAYSDHFDEDTTLYYSGSFDGRGYTIRGLYVSVPSGPIGEQVCLGLFSAVKDAMIQNVTVAGSVAGFNGNMGGIAGCLRNSTIKNCANHCTVKSTTAQDAASYVGGIAGAMDTNSTICDCYNTGKITEDQFSQYHCTGGIVGYSGGSTVSNCYNVGEVAGNGGRSGEIVGLNDNEYAPSTVSNCYYLSDTSGGEARTKTEFADGTVLAALIHGRADGEHPWAAECKYLAAAGKTLPVFQGQGDTHSHSQSGGWESNDTEHWQVCACGAVFHKADHNGGEATCLVKAKCRDCGQPYGETNPNNHTGTAQWTATAAVHQKKWSCCGSAFTPEEAHHWENGVCRDCGYGCLHGNLAYSPAKAATASAEGSIEYWYCASCGKYFADKNAQQEITQAETVILKRQYPVGAPSYPITVPDAPNGTVTVSPKSAAKGATVTITVTPDSGYVLEAISAVDQNGGALQLTDKGDGKYSFVMPSGKVDIDASFKKLTETSPFDDVSTDAYYYEAVKWAAENGITGGTGDAAFSPDAVCSRAQIVAFLWRSEKSPAAGTANPFADVKADAYYAAAVQWAVETGVTQGTGDTAFSPDADCTRAQIVTFLWRCAK